MSPNKPYYWIISFDNLAGDDLPAMLELPNFRRYLEKAAYCPHVDTIYPSVTYPAHTTIVTGKYPANHGITNNTLFQPHRLTHEDWNWLSRRIHGKTLFDVTHELGLSTASFLWPVSGESLRGSRHITYNMPEIFANRKWDNQVLTSLRHGSKVFQLSAFLRHGRELDGIKQPALDNFLHKVVMETAEEIRPQVQFIHYVDLDSTRHLYGHSSPEAYEALQRHDQRLGDILDFIEENGLMNDTHLVVLGDHSSLDEHTAIYLNVLFVQKGWLTLRPDGRVKSWKVLCHTCDGSAYIHIKDRSMVMDVVEALKEFSFANDHCIEKIVKAPRTAAGRRGQTALLIEARRGYYFLDEPDTGEVLHRILPGDVGKIPHITLSTHGYSPTKKNYQTFFSMMGPRIQSGEISDTMQLVDVGPTIAYLMDGILPEADGVVRKAFFRE